MLLLPAASGTLRELQLAARDMQRQRSVPVRVRQR